MISSNWEVGLCRKPLGINLTITSANIDIISNFLSDLRKITSEVKTSECIEKEENNYGLSKEYFDSYIDYMLDFVKN